MLWTGVADQIVDALRSYQTAITAENNSITESKPKPTRALEEAAIPAMIATPASTTIAVGLAPVAGFVQGRAHDAGPPRQVVGV